MKNENIVLSKNNSNNETMGQNQQRRNENWSEQKTRMDSMLTKLKNEIQDVKSMDKDLTRQFINLGGLINKIKNDQLDEGDDYEEDDLALINEDSPEEEKEHTKATEVDPGVKNVENSDTRL